MPWSTSGVGVSAAVPSRTARPEFGFRRLLAFPLTHSFEALVTDQATGCHLVASKQQEPDRLPPAQSPIAPEGGKLPIRPPRSSSGPVVFVFRRGSLPRISVRRYA